MSTESPSVRSGLLRVRTTVLFFLFVGMSACSVAIDAADLEGGGCPAGTKACSDECVATNDPEFGCARKGCAGCALPNAVAVCSSAGECDVGACIGRFKDCDENPDCETDTGFDSKNCGSCGAVCPALANGDSACSGGHCTLGGCAAGFRSCDGNPMNGCEQNVQTSHDHCGSCDKACTSSESCVDGNCV